VEGYFKLVKEVSLRFTEEEVVRLLKEAQKEKVVADTYYHTSITTIAPILTLRYTCIKSYKNSGGPFPSRVSLAGFGGGDPTSI